MKREHKITGFLTSVFAYGHRFNEEGCTHALSSRDMKIVVKTVNSWYNRKNK